MTINLQKPDIRELKPKITVFGVGGGGGNAVNNMINGGLQGVEFVVANTDAQALTMSRCERVVQLGIDVTQGLGAGSQPDVGRASAEECMDEIADHLQGTHMAFVTAGMGGGTGTGAAPVVARAARELGILTVGVVTKPFHFEGQRRMTTAEEGIAELQKNVDTLIVIPNQNLFRIANDKTTFADAFGMADQVLYSGVACITDLMVKEGLINLDFADVRSVMREMGKAMMGTGEASGEGRAIQAAEAAISNPLLDETSMRGAKGLLISITGGRDLTLFEVDEAATRIREEIESDANIILGATFDETLEGIIRVSVVATGIDRTAQAGMDGAALETFGEAASRSKPAIPAPSATASILGKKEPTTAAPQPKPAAQPAAEAKPAIARDGVKIEPYKPAASISDEELENEFKVALDKELNPDSDFMVPEPETPESVAKGARIPQIEDFPPTVRAEVERNSEAGAEDGGPVGLLRKLAHGFSHKEHQPQAARTEPQASPARPAAPAAHPRAEDNPYAPKRAALDNNGRVNPAGRPASDEDELEIPAFLRRQTG